MRLPAIDRFRGLAIFLMIAANFLEYVRWIPGWLKHAPDVGFTVVDCIMPAFVFAIGLTFRGSVLRRVARDGALRTSEHVVTRAMALVGIGMLFTLGQISYGFDPNANLWGVLQAIGLSIVLVYPALFLPSWARLLLVLGGMGLFQWALDTYWLDIVRDGQCAGLAGSLSWACLLMLATVFGDLYAEARHRKFLVLGSGTLAAGLALAFVFPISKHRMSCSFDLTACGVVALAFAMMAWLTDRSVPGLSFLEMWGRNPLVLYILHLLLLAFFLVPSAPWWHAEAPLWLLLLELAALVGTLHLVAWGLWRKGIVISL